MRKDISKIESKLKEEKDGQLAMKIVNKIKKLTLNQTLKTSDHDNYDYLKRNCPRLFTVNNGNRSVVVEYIIENEVIYFTSLK
ncbi:hypothetical protein [Photobacterium leiognathi]|uniref:hypothetical protein n=1 Tax=Photobacterium leiognathi TaxID=553611 RepID=UPI00273855C7|nr:hypothetical protein [Photobacterium leiognathi]